MLKIATLVWIVLGTTLAGAALAVIVATPSLVDQSMKLIPWAVLGGFITAIPVSWVVAGKINKAG